MRYFLSMASVFALALGAFADDAPPQNEPLPVNTEPRHVRVLWMEEPMTQAVVSWSTTEPGVQSRLYYDTESRDGVAGDYQSRVSRIHSGEYTRTPDDLNWGEPPLYYHHALMEGLEPATTYYFVASTDGQVSKEFHFVTAPDDDRPIKVLFGGDSRIGGRDPYLHKDRRNINRLMAKFAQEHADIIAFMHGGDFYQRAELRYMRPWLTDHELCITEDNRIIPIIPARGNHDMAVGFEEMFHWPGWEHNYYYKTRLSAEVALVTLNTEISMAGAQRAYAERTMRDLRPDHRWLVVQYHKPAYPSVRGWTDGEDRRYYFVPVMERNNVDLVCESHDHALKRTLPIRDGGPHKHGITYIGDGGLGVPQRTPDPSRWYLQEPGIAKAAHHVHILEFHEDKIRGRAFGLDDDVLDDFTLLPGQTVVPEE